MNWRHSLANSQEDGRAPAEVPSRCGDGSHGHACFPGVPAPSRVDTRALPETVCAHASGIFLCNSERLFSSE